MEKNSFYIDTYGCTSNKADSYIISSILKKSKYTEVNIENAEYIIVNTCAVKQQTENKIKAQLRNLYEMYKKDSNRHIIIAGCLPHIAPDYIEIIKKIIPNFSAIIDLDNIHEIPLILEELKAGNRNLIFKNKELIDKTQFLIDHPKGKLTGIIPISEGCQGSCTYCCVKNARGKLNCYDPEKIIRNINHQLEQGIKQILLTSQDCSVYEHNTVKLYDLIKNIVDLNYKFYLRIGMLNPRFLIENFEQLELIYNLNKVYQFLHIPIQSGSDDILTVMNRPYKISDIYEKIELLKKKFPLLTISTDIICGFPGETDTDFQKTIDLIKWLKPEILNISKFTPRPATKAKQMQQVNSRVIKQRSIQLSKIFRESLIDMNKHWEGWEGEVLILHSSERENQAFGRNLAYKNIFIENYTGEYGKFKDIRIDKVDGFNLFGTLI